MSEEKKYKCNMCKGLGIVSIKEIEWNNDVGNFDYSKMKIVESKCFRCKGSGYVDWITNVIDNQDWSLEITAEARVLKDEGS